MKTNPPVVSIVMGSDSDLPTMEQAGEALDLFKIPYEFGIISAHRTPDEVADFGKEASSRGIRVIISGAGGAAHLPGMIASYTELPVIGVPVPIGPMQGEDALYSIVQMPKGVPVATVAIGNAWNAGILAAQILGCHDSSMRKKMLEYKTNLKEKVQKSRKSIKKK